MVFSANSRSSLGTSSFGSVMGGAPSVLSFWAVITTFPPPWRIGERRQQWTGLRLHRCGPALILLDESGPCDNGIFLDRVRSDAFRAHASFKTFGHCCRGQTMASLRCSLSGSARKIVQRTFHRAQEAQDL